MSFFTYAKTLMCTQSFSCRVHLWPTTLMMAHMIQGIMSFLSAVFLAVCCLSLWWMFEVCTLIFVDCESDNLHSAILARSHLFKSKSCEC